MEIGTTHEGRGAGVRHSIEDNLSRLRITVRPVCGRGGDAHQLRIKLRQQSSPLGTARRITQHIAYHGQNITRRGDQRSRYDLTWQRTLPMPAAADTSARTRDTSNRGRRRPMRAPGRRA